MTRRGNCWDDIVIASYLATLEKELPDVAVWYTHAQVLLDLSEFIEVWYSR